MYTCLGFVNKAEGLSLQVRMHASFFFFMNHMLKNLVYTRQDHIIAGVESLQDPMEHRLEAETILPGGSNGWIRYSLHKHAHAIYRIFLKL